MKRKIYLFVGLFLSLAIVSIITKEIANKISDKDSSTPTTESVSATATDASGDNELMYYSYDDVMNMVGYLATSDDMSTQLSRLVDPLSISNYITTGYVKSVASIINAPDDVYKDILGKDDSAYVDTGAFDEIYDNMVATSKAKGLFRREVFVLDKGELLGEDKKTYVSISDGRDEYIFDTEFSDAYADRLLDVYVKDNVIFKVNSASDSEVILKNAWIIKKAGECTFLYKGYTKSYPVETGVDLKSGIVATLTVCDGRIVAADTGYQSVEDQLVSIDERINLKNHAGYEIDEDFAIYDVTDEVACEESREILKGYPKFKLVLKDGIACAAIIEGNPVSENIRVILSNDNQSSYEMKSVTVSCTGPCKLEYPEDEEDTLAAGEKLTINYEDYKRGNRIKIIPDNPLDGICVESIKRECGNPVYYGSLEISIKSEYLYIVNELPLEEYLYGVVSSEVPADFELEAQKALAVCARAYAYKKMTDGSFSEFRAHLDDTSFCQTYNNVLKTPQSVRAVKDTYGMVPTYEGKIIFPMYFSTSCGSTCSNDEIWGGKAYDYLVADLETIENVDVDLSDEETFRQFMENSLGYDTIESELPYYRWSIQFSEKDMTDIINSNLSSRIEKTPDDFMLKKGEDDYTKAGDIDTVGDVKSVSVVERGESGMVVALEIEGTENTIKVTGQTNIRNLISPEKQSIVKKDGSVVSGWTSLPSTFYYIEKTSDGFVINGGGFGHGVGLSQNGANVLARMGYNYKYIIRHYFSYVDLQMIYDVKEDEEDE